MKRQRANPRTTRTTEGAPSRQLGGTHKIHIARGSSSTKMPKTLSLTWLPPKGRPHRQGGLNRRGCEPTSGTDVLAREGES